MIIYSLTVNSQLHYNSNGYTYIKFQLLIRVSISAMPTFHESYPLKHKRSFVMIINEVMQAPRLIATCIW